jgi:hypothetical protein
LQKLIAEGKLARPARTLRFIWPPEIEGTTTLLNARPEFASRIKAVVHMDMVGGGPATKAIFHVTRGPMSLPSFVYDVGEAFGDFVNRESDLYASTGAALYPFVSAEGGKEALQAEFADYSMGSDHDVYQEGSFRIPAIYLNDWPDRYIHTNGDTSANIDPTKLKRAAFIGAASGYFLAGMSAKDIGPVFRVIKTASLHRVAKALQISIELQPVDMQIHARTFLQNEDAAIDSLGTFAVPSESDRAEFASFKATRQTLFFSQGLPHGEIAVRFHSVFTDDEIVYVRNEHPKGPMSVFGYDYFADHLATKNLPRPKLFDYKGLWGSGEDYAYEALNFVDGKRDVGDIQWALSAEYGPVNFDLLLEYLSDLESIGVLKRVPNPRAK